MFDKVRDCLKTAHDALTRVKKSKTDAWDQIGRAVSSVAYAVDRLVDDVDELRGRLPDSRHAPVCEIAVGQIKSGDTVVVQTGIPELGYFPTDAEVQATRQSVERFLRQAGFTDVHVLVGYPGLKLVKLDTKK